MTDPQDASDAARTESRSHLLPEEQAAGSDDATTQARLVLEDSDARTDDPVGTKDESVQTPDER